MYRLQTNRSINVNVNLLVYVKMYRRQRYKRERHNKITTLGSIKCIEIGQLGHIIVNSQKHSGINSCVDN